MFITEDNNCLHIKNDEVQIYKTDSDYYVEVRKADVEKNPELYAERLGFKLMGKGYELNALSIEDRRELIDDLVKFFNMKYAHESNVKNGNFVTNLYNKNKGEYLVDDKGFLKNYIIPTSAKYEDEYLLVALYLEKHKDVKRFELSKFKEDRELTLSEINILQDLISEYGANTNQYYRVINEKDVSAVVPVKDIARNEKEIARRLSEINIKKILGLDFGFLYEVTIKDKDGKEPIDLNYHLNQKCNADDFYGKFEKKLFCGDNIMENGIRDLAKELKVPITASIGVFKSSADFFSKEHKHEVKEIRETKIVDKIPETPNFRIRANEQYNDYLLEDDGKIAEISKQFDSNPFERDENPDKVSCVGLTDEDYGETAFKCLSDQTVTEINNKILEEMVRSYKISFSPSKMRHKMILTIYDKEDPDREVASVLVRENDNKFDMLGAAVADMTNTNYSFSREDSNTIDDLEEVCECFGIDPDDYYRCKYVHGRVNKKNEVLLIADKNNISNDNHINDVLKTAANKTEKWIDNKVYSLVEYEIIGNNIEVVNDKGNFYGDYIQTNGMKEHGFSSQPAYYVGSSENIKTFLLEYGKDIGLEKEDIKELVRGRVRNNSIELGR